MRIWVVNIAATIALCGCVQAARQSSPPTVPHAIAAAPARPAAHPAKTRLSGAQKDKLFRGFQKWQAAARQRELATARQGAAARDSSETAQTDSPLTPALNAADAAGASLHSVAPPVSRD